jgi:hypothetical protein
MRNERAGHTSQPTASIDEARLRLAQQCPRFQERTRFIAIAAKYRRPILVDAAPQENAGGHARGSRGGIADATRTSAGGPVVLG